MQDSSPTLGASLVKPLSTAPVDDDTVLGGLDTAQLRNAVHRRLFGTTIDPVRIGRFPILRRVGHGGMGVVFAAYDNELDRKIAIKLLHAGVADDAEAAAARVRLLREAKALARLSHPAVVQVYEAGEHDGHVYVAMEFVEGVTLRRWIEAEPRTSLEIVAMYLQAARGLAAAHAAGLVHRDFKPDNAIVGIDGRVRVLDFGLALASRDATPAGADDPTPAANVGEVRLTRTGSLVGTPAYMAPEQFLGTPTDARTDQFSFAVALFEALFDARPFAGDTVDQLAGSVVQGKLVVPSRRKVSSVVVRVLRRALARQPADRFASMDELVAALAPAQGMPRWKSTLLKAGAFAVVSLIVALLRDDGARERAAALTEEVATERTRADDAERELALREHMVLVGEAGLLIEDDPTRALQVLAALPDDAEAWHGAAWDVAARAVDAGIATEVIAVPDGWRGRRLLGEHTALVRRESDLGPVGLWDRERGVVEELYEPGVDHVDVSPDAQWILRSGREGVRLQHRELGSSWTLLPDPCGIATLGTDPLRVSAICPGDGHPYEVTWRLHERDGTAQISEMEIDDDDPRWTMLQIEDVGIDRHLGVSPDHTLGAGVGDGILYLTNIATGAVWKHDIGAQIVAGVFDPASRWLALSVAGRPMLVSAVDRDAAPEQLALDGDIVELRWSPDSQFLSGMRKNGTIVLWHVEDRRPVGELRGMKGFGESRWAADGVFETLHARELRRWAFANRRRLGRDVVSVDAGPDGSARLLADGRVQLHRGDEVIELGVHAKAGELLLVPGGSVVTAGGNRLQLGSASAPMRELATTRDPTVEEIAIDGDGSTLAWIDARSIHLLELATGVRRELAPRPGHDWEDLAFAPNGELWAIEDPTGEGSDALRRLVPATLAEIGSTPLPAGETTVMAPMPDGRVAVGTSEGGLAIVDIDSGIARSMAGDDGHLVRLAVSTDGTLLATARLDGTVTVWNVVTGVGHVIPREQGPLLAAADPARIVSSRRVLAFADDTALLLVDDHFRLQSYRMEVPADPDELRAWVRQKAAAFGE